MAKKKTTLKNLSKVLKEIERQAKEDAFTGRTLCGAIDLMLDDLCSDDFFGTESQLDPRGDQRD